MSLIAFRVKKLNCFKPLIISVLITIILSLLCAIFASKKIILNSTDSLPHGFYYITKESYLRRGQIVCFSVPDNFKNIVYGRNLLKNGGIMMKEIIAIHDDFVCSDGINFSIKSNNHEYNGIIQKTDRKGLPLPAYFGCGNLQENLLFVGSPANPLSLDSRYFGPIHRQNIIGVARAIWIF